MITYGLMGDLFGDPEIAAHLTPEAEIAAMIRFEEGLARATARLGIIPEQAGAALQGLSLTAEELRPGAAAAGVAGPELVRLLRARIGPPWGDFLHWGATSQDVVDTGLILRLSAIIALLEERLTRLVQMLNDQARRFADAPMAARTRSQIATPTSLGLRIKGWAAPLERSLERLAQIKPRLLWVQLGGASGNLSVYGDKGLLVMQALAEDLGLIAPDKPWHVERDGLNEFAHWLALVSGLIGRMGGDLLIMGRSEIHELAAGKGGGSSTMPHKANPVLPEALISLARMNFARAALMDQALLHQEERDGAAWALEWAALPEMLIAAGAGLRHGLTLAADLRPDAAAMAAALAGQGGAAYAEALAFALAAHTPLSEAQALVKQAAQQGGDLPQAVAALAAARGLPAPAVEAGAPAMARRLASL